MKRKGWEVMIILGFICDVVLLSLLLLEIFGEADVLTMVVLIITTLNTNVILLDAISQREASKNSSL